MRYLLEKIELNEHQYFNKLINRQIDLWKFYQTYFRACVVMGIETDFELRHHLLCEALNGNISARNKLFSMTSQDKEVIGSFRDYAVKIKSSEPIRRNYYKKGVVLIQKAHIM